MYATPVVGQALSCSCAPSGQALPSNKVGLDFHLRGGYWVAAGMGRMGGRGVVCRVVGRRRRLA